MGKFKIKMLEAYEVEVDVEGDTPDQAKLAAIDATEGGLYEAVAPIGGKAKLAWRQFKVVAPAPNGQAGSNKGTPHKSKQKGER